MMQVAESGKWICDRCRCEMVRLLEEKLQSALLETEDLKQKNKRMEEQLRVMAEGSEVTRCDTVQRHHEGEKCLVMGDSVILNVGTERRNMVVECFPGVTIDQMRRAVDNRDLWHSTPKIKKRNTVDIFVISNVIMKQWCGMNKWQRGYILSFLSFLRFFNFILDFISLHTS
jgi:hypothetical protein